MDADKIRVSMDADKVRPTETFYVNKIRVSMDADKVRPTETFYVNKIIYCARVKIELPDLPNIKEVQVRNFYKLDLIYSK
jgi:hypothetical protein